VVGSRSWLAVGKNPTQPRTQISRSALSVATPELVMAAGFEALGVGRVSRQCGRSPWKVKASPARTRVHWAAVPFRMGCRCCEPSEAIQASPKERAPRPGVRGALNDRAAPMGLRAGRVEASASGGESRWCAEATSATGLCMFPEKQAVLCARERLAQACRRLLLHGRATKRSQSTCIRKELPRSYRVWKSPALSFACRNVFRLLGNGAQGAACTRSQASPTAANAPRGDDRSREAYP
jgi:hypothetical protein